MEGHLSFTLLGFLIMVVIIPINEWMSINQQIKKLILTFAKKDQYQLETGSSNIVTRDVLMCYKLCYSVLKYI